MNMQEELPGLANILPASKNTNMNDSLATGKQEQFVMDLVKTRDLNKTIVGTPSEKLINNLKQGGHVTKYSASQLITQLLTSPKLSASASLNPRGTKAPSIDVGFYKIGSRVLKAVRSPQTGNMYTKELHSNGWEYLAGGIHILRNNEYTKLTLDEAKELGKIYGFCVACGRTLTDETSIANGIGPICADKF